MKSGLICSKYVFFEIDKKVSLLCVSNVVLWVLLQFNACLLALARHTKWDETTVTTTLNPGGTTDPVRSTWSVMIVRILFRVVWHSGKAMEFRIAARSCNKFCLVGSSLAHVLAFFALVLAANH